jgi:hypothetical protein
LAIILGLVFALSLVGCAQTDETNLNVSDITSTQGLQDSETGDEIQLQTQKQDNETDTSESKPTSASSSVKEDSEKTEKPQSKPTNTSTAKKTKKDVKKIVDESHKYLKTGNIVKFYEKDNYEYYTVSGKKDGIMVYFKDGTKMGVVEAFKKKIVTLSDLKKYKVKYIKEWSNYGTFDLTDYYDCDVAKKPQEFYRDKYFTYTFSTQKADYVKYLDKDGKTWLLSEALKSGKTDIYTAGILLFYNKNVIGDEPVLVDVTKHINFINAPSRCFYSDENYFYYYPDITFISVYYPDGTEEYLEDALEQGKVKISDLKKFDIEYYKISKKYLSEDIWIIDHTKYYDYGFDKKEDEFYRDDKYIYLYPTEKNEYVEIYLRESNKECRIDVALDRKYIDIDTVLKQMDKQNIEYIKRPIGK